MWWDSDDYSSFKDSAVAEIKNIMLVDDRIDCKTAQILLYQPPSSTSVDIKLKLKTVYTTKDIKCPQNTCMNHNDLKGDSKIPVTDDHISLASLRNSDEPSECKYPYIVDPNSLFIENLSDNVPENLKTITITNTKSQLDLTKMAEEENTILSQQKQQGHNEVEQLSIINKPSNHQGHSRYDSSSEEKSCNLSPIKSSKIMKTIGGCLYFGCDISK